MIRQGRAAGRLSLGAVVLLFMLIALVRWRTLTPNELGWDAFGYYLYMPAKFIHHDPWLTDRSWIEAVHAQYHASDTLYQIGPGPEGSVMYFFLMGMALLYAPFFFLGHAIALGTGAPADGFSTPYQYTIALGCLVYVLLGLLLFRRILLRFFSDRTASVVIIVVGLGTNYFHFMAVKDLETASALFMLMAALVWNTLRWHERPNWWNALGMGLCTAWITLVKPSEIFCALIPLLWNTGTVPALREKLRLSGKHWPMLLAAVGLGLAWLSPQLIYWHAKTGALIYDSYKNAGIGLDIASPHIADVLFSYRKGWLLYTPIMLFAIAGLFLARKTDKALLPTLLVYPLVTFWIAASWTEWWYGASYSIRPMITTYVLLAIPLGRMIERIRSASPVARYSGSSLIVCLLALNLFQNWQFERWIIHPYRTTGKYYWSVFGQVTKPTKAQRALLSVQRSFDGEAQLLDTNGYQRSVLVRHTFESAIEGWTGAAIMDSTRNSLVARFDGHAPFFTCIDVPYESLTDKDHLWLRVRYAVQLPADLAEDPPCIVMTMTRKGGDYGYRALCADQAAKGRWTTITADYLTPPVRDPNDRLRVYVWHRAQAPVLIDDLQVDVFTPE